MGFAFVFVNRGVASQRLECGPLERRLSGRFSDRYRSVNGGVKIYFFSGLALIQGSESLRLTSMVGIGLGEIWPVFGNGLL